MSIQSDIIGAIIDHGPACRNDIIARVRQHDPATVTIALAALVRHHEIQKGPDGTYSLRELWRDKTLAPFVRLRDYVRRGPQKKKAVRKALKDIPNLQRVIDHAIKAGDIHYPGNDDIALGPPQQSQDSSARRWNEERVRPAR